jgi:diacylglycerol kinase (ATP)
MQDARGPVILIVSPHAGHAAARAAAEAALRAAGVEVGSVVDVSALDERLPQGKAWKDAGYGAAVAAGGDGTVGAVASHVAETGLPLGILPLGTANDVARSLDIPMELEAACAVVARGAVRQIDLGCARPGETEPGALQALAQARTAGIATPQTERIQTVAEAGAYFVHALTLGLNVEFARLATNVAQRQRFGPLTYFASALQALTRFRPVAVEVRLQGVEAGAYGAGPLPEGISRGATVSVERSDTTRIITGEVVQVAAVITPVFGGARNFRVPGVALADGLIDFILIEALQSHQLNMLIERIRALLERALAHPQEREDVQSELMRLDVPGLWRFKAQAGCISQPDGLDVTLDGEIRARTPLAIWTALRALSVVLPDASMEEASRA